jgi:phosphomannomutase
MRVVVYEHTAVGREILARILRGLGAEVHPLGRSAAFVPIDTEAISAAQMETLAALAKEARASLGAIDAIVSTDGDSDRPLLVGVDQDGRPRFFGGDTLGVVAADYLGADAIAVPITSTDAIELHFADRLKAGTMVCRRTRVGSPWVIAAAPTLPGRRRVGWEANGGFLTFSAIERDGRPLAPLPTRDAALPIIAALHAAKLRRVGLDRLFAELPRRFARSALIDGVPPAAQRALVQRYAVDDPDVAAAVFAGDEVRALGEDGSARVLSPDVALRLRRMRDGLARHFDARRGFGTVVRIDLLDGARMTFDDGDVAHVRVSGNAPQMRIYAVSSTEERADRAIALAVREPDGILHTLVREAEHQDEPR